MVVAAQADLLVAVLQARCLLPSRLDRPAVVPVSSAATAAQWTAATSTTGSMQQTRTHDV